MRKQNAFTLIELLIIMAIIGILAGIILSVLDIARDKAKDASFKSSAKSAYSAMKACCIGDAFIQEKVSGSGSDVGVCSDSGVFDGLYPGDDSIGTVVVNEQCVEGRFEVVVTPGLLNAGGCESVTYDETGEISLIGCE
ncbi:MAG: hypothetical protein CR972_00795 [Candidatus Moraniibacteriota bacterium]|nr:MAG: hypothetical protein CR972_00795 [Candidatus Moranbacteria bacterium]